MYTVELTKSAQKDLGRVPREAQRRIATAIDDLRVNPRPPGAATLADQEGLYRIRVGDYRIIYHVGDAELVVLVVKIGDRKEVYRFLS